MQSVTSGLLGLVHFWRLSWGTCHLALHLPLPVCWTHFFSARINNLWQVWTKGSLCFLVVRLLFRFLLQPFGCVALLLAHYLNWISHHFLFVCPFRTLFICLSKFHSVACCVVCLAVVEKLHRCAPVPVEWVSSTSARLPSSCPVKQMVLLANWTRVRILYRHWRLEAVVIVTVIHTVVIQCPSEMYNTEG